MKEITIARNVIGTEALSIKLKNTKLTYEEFVEFLNNENVEIDLPDQKAYLKYPKRKLIGTITGGETKLKHMKWRKAELKPTGVFFLSKD